MPKIIKFTKTYIGDYVDVQKSDCQENQNLVLIQTRKGALILVFLC